MKHFVVVAHPAIDSLTMKLAGAYTAELEKLGHTQLTNDLYRSGFNPILDAQGLQFGANVDVADEQDQIRAADALTLIYPLWWLSMPAMMKGYIDRVFARGFAYERDATGIHALWSGKKAVVITVAGTAVPSLKSADDRKPTAALQDTLILRAVGFELVEHVHVEELDPKLSMDSVQHHLARVASCVRAHFPAID